MKYLIQLNNITKRYPGVVLFDDVSVGFAADAKIGVIGRNGAGKSTLCNFLTGGDEPQSGSIDTGRELRLSYLRQDDPFDLGETVRDYLMRATGKEEWRCGKTAGRFNLKNERFDGIPIGELSGGFRTRVKLAEMLLNDPNFLVLDEPTNYLDLNTLLMLERFLREYSGAFLIVSHDREFLKKTCRQTLEIENGEVTLYPGGIEEYLEFKEDIIEHRMRLNRNLEQKQKRLEEFVERFKAKATKARQAQSRKKQLKRIETIEITHPAGTVNIRLPQVETRKKGYSLLCEDLAIGYPGNDVAAGITLSVERGAHIAVLGDNGQGKTTFLRTIANDLVSKGGSMAWSAGEEIAYYAQHVYQELDPNTDIFTYLQRKAAPGLLPQDIRNMAGCFLFHGDDIFKPIRVLSGGERARVCLAGLLLSGKHVLLLDEPTNHLDFETVEALGSALAGYNGTVFFVSHDRTFVSMLATGIVSVGDGRIEHYPGSYEDYVYHLEQTVDRELGGVKQPAKSAGVSDNKNHRQLRKERKAILTALKKKIAAAEEKISLLDREKKAILSVFSFDPKSYSTGRNKRLDDVNTELSALETEWFDLQQQLDDLNGEV